MPNHKWIFKAHFRKEAYGWNGTAKASKRMKEAVSEIKKVAKKDPALAGEGVIELFIRLYPALMHIDSSSGALGTAMNNTIESLIPVLINAPWEMNTRGIWLEKLYDAILEDGWGTFDFLRDRWAEVCVFPGLAHLWADRLLPAVQEVWSNPGFSHFVGTDMCLSCLLFTRRYDELFDLLQLRTKRMWFDHKFWAMALVHQGKQQEALDYALQIHTEAINEQHSIDSFCEDTLIQMGKIEDAYQRYGLQLPPYGTYLNIYRNICKKYPTLDKRTILLDCINQSRQKGKWFAAAKSEGFLDIALECAEHTSSDPNTLIKAVRHYEKKNPDFAIQVGVWAIIRFMTGSFYEDVTPSTIAVAYQDVENVAKENHQIEVFKEHLGREILKHSKHCNPHLKAVVVYKLKEENR